MHIRALFTTFDFNDGRTAIAIAGGQASRAENRSPIWTDTPCFFPLKGGAQTYSGTAVGNGLAAPSVRRHWPAQPGERWSAWLAAAADILQPRIHQCVFGADRIDVFRGIGI